MRAILAGIQGDTMSANDELKNQDLAEFLEAGEKLLYSGHGQTGSTIGLSLSILSPFLAGRVKDTLKQWRVAITNRRVLLVRRDSKEQRSASFDQLTQIELKRSMVINRTLILRFRDAEDIKLGLPAARNDYSALEQALRKAAPQLRS